MAIKFYHNPRCVTSRKGLALLRARHIEPDIIDYLKTPLDRAQLRGLLKMLRMKPSQLLRKREKAAISKAGIDVRAPDEDKILEAMAADPILIERPIVVNGNRAALGRPPENILEVL